eukprot:PhF_6_TR29125/c1_g1_i1/m.42512
MIEHCNAKFNEDCMNFTDGTCKPKCEKRSLFVADPTKFDCDRDVGTDCMFDNMAKQCVTACNQYKNEQDCWGETSDMCEWDKAKGICQKTCMYRYTATQGTQCASDPKCKWEASRTLCTVACNLIKDNTCTNETMCVWDATKNTCLMKCENRGYTTQTDCTTNSNPRWGGTAGDCNWNALTTKCLGACSLNLAEEPCEANPMCEWGYDANGALKCMQSCGTQFTSAGPCDATRSAVPLKQSCEWDGSSNPGVCRQSCKNIKDRGDCVKYTTCEWNASSTPQCRPTCTAQYTRPTDQKACSTDTRCMWNTDIPKCLQDCKYKNSTALCNVEKESCFWAPATLSCPLIQNIVPAVKQFGTDGTQAGGKMMTGLLVSNKGASEVVYTVIIPTGARYTTFKTRVALQDSCLSCMFSPNVDGVTFEVYRDTITGTKSTSIFRNCNVSMDPDQISIDITGWKSIVLRVDMGKNTACDDALWGGATLCSNETEQCERLCAYRYGSDEPSCSVDTDCMWNPRTSACVQNCKYKSIDQCRDELCEIDTTWSCTPKCKYLSKGSCDLDPRCDWADTKCLLDCTQNLDTTTCITDTRCEWDNNQCQYTCNVNTNVDSCNKDSRCKWNAKDVQCRKKCDRVKKKADCSSDIQCEWTDSDTCVMKCYYRYTTKTPCNFDMSCMWDPNTQTCKKGCNLLLTDQACATDDMCEWNGGCEQKCVYQYESQPLCNTERC